MPVESWITPEETPALAEAATVLIEHRLSRFSAAERAAYWASITKCYNTPYNPPAKAAVAKPRAAVAAVEVSPIEIDLTPVEMPAAFLPGALPAEIQAA